MNTKRPDDVLLLPARSQDFELNRFVEPSDIFELPPPYAVGEVFQIPAAGGAEVSKPFTYDGPEGKIAISYRMEDAGLFYSWYAIGDTRASYDLWVGITPERNGTRTPSRWFELGPVNTNKRRYLIERRHISEQMKTPWRPVYHLEPTTR